MTNLRPEIPDFKRDILPLDGDMRFPLINDYMFTACFQHNTYALKGLLAEKLNIDPEEITSLEVMNPMEKGSSVDDKDIVLDVKVCLNNLTLIDIEMQVAHYDYLPERFLHQLCRIYSKSLSKGSDYSSLPPVIHIAIMDCDLFPKGDLRNTDDFLSEYYMMNVENHQIFSGNFHMEVVSLKHLENAVDKEDPNGIYQWAKLLKSTTWEEFTMIAENNKYMEALAGSVCALCNDPKFVEECERHLRGEWEYNSMMVEANRKGMAQGLERGMAQGLEQGMAQGLEQGLTQGREEGIKALIADNLEEGRSAEVILNKLTRHYSLSMEEAESYYKRYSGEV